jgi:hypothetical protein
MEKNIGQNINLRSINSNYCGMQFTLQGSQPYVLTGNWPQGFTKSQTQFVPDYSMKNVVSYNQTKCKFSTFGLCKK